jgi:glycosyltransferase involved in cell wall biosynthesis
MRLAYLTPIYPSLSQTFIRREIAGLEARGHSVHRFSIKPCGDTVDPADKAEAGKTFHLLAQSGPKLVLRALVVLAGRPVAAFGALSMAFRMHRASERGLLRHLAYLVEAAVLLHHMREAAVEHCHVHFGTNAAAVARLIRRLGGPPYSMTIHGPDELDAPIGFSLGAKMEDAAFTVAITDYCGAQLRRWVDLSEWSKIKRVQCTVGDEWFDAACPISADAATLVCVGRLTAQKGQLLLLDAMAALARDGVQGRLVLVGDGEMRDVVETRIRDLNLGERVILAGWQDESQVREHLRNARALVLASFAEGLPVVIMEALAMARPVVATTITGIPELVRDGENGWLVTAGNVDELAAAMREALEAPLDRLNAKGQAGAVRARERHSTATEVAKLEGFFLLSLGRDES